MSRFISRKNPISAAALKRRSIGTVAVHHNGSWEDVRFTRCAGGWLRERTDIINDRAVVVSSSDVARECNHAFGCAQSWAEIY